MSKKLIASFDWNTVERIDSSNENVAKFVFEKPDAIAEAVLYKYPTYEERTVICCSTQSGCPVGCRFCGAGDYFVRSLTAAEISSQPTHLLLEAGVDPSKIQRLQIMFMSMGEPMLNFESLATAMRSLHADYPQAKLLISTSAPRNFQAFQKLIPVSIEIPTIGLQFSVHESTDAARARLIPSPTMTLKEMSQIGFAWSFATGRRPFFNYCVHSANNTADDVKRLADNFDPSVWEATLSVICERDEHVAAANARQRQLTADFMGLMVDAGYSTRMFDPAGQDDIGGGCGQLWFVQDWMKKNGELAKPSRGCGLPKVHTPTP